MIREIGAVPRSALIGVAHAAELDGTSVAVLDGEGWGATEVALELVEEHRIPHGDDPLAAIAPLLDRLSVSDGVRGWNGAPRASRWIGYVAYEAARALERASWSETEARPAPVGAALILRRHRVVARRDLQSGIVAVEADDPRAIDDFVQRLAHAPAPPVARPLALTPIDQDRVHQARVERALELIAEGHVYVVNLARTFVGTGPQRATELLGTLPPARFLAALDVGDHLIACASPELFLDVERGRVLTSPIKGTRPRGHDAESDRALARALDDDPKERAELVMVVDLERNDLGRIARIGTVRLRGAPRIESSRSVHHRVQDVVARTDASLGEILRATFPSGSVTGAPKVRAMEIIAALEGERRGLYCGAILSLRGDGTARAAMAIRTAVVERGSGRATYHAGGGIVADSIPEREVLETRWKARAVVAR